MAVAGFDNLPDSEAWSPSLTTVESYPRAIGTTSAELLLKRLSNAEGERVQIRMPPKLIVRDSTRVRTADGPAARHLNR
jgi:LacI family transcriptional regulator